MKERPILFSGPMVRAILAGTKSQTRRLVNFDKLRVRVRGTVTGDLPYHATKASGVRRAQMNPHGAVSVEADDGKLLGLKPGEFDFVCPYADGVTHLGNYGDGRHMWTIEPDGSQRLWVRESHCIWPAGDQLDVPCIPPTTTVEYAADHPDRKGWRPSIHMPRWASRITLAVESVRVERLQDITEEDAKAEGVTPLDGIAAEQRIPCDRLSRTHGSHPHVVAFAVLWDEINGDRDPWIDDPWVWRIAFRRAELAREAAE